jgi:hypothetical protein
MCFDDAVFSKVVWSTVEIDKCAGNIGGHHVNNVTPKREIDFGRLFVTVFDDVVHGDVCKSLQLDRYLGPGVRDRHQNRELHFRGPPAAPRNPCRTRTDLAR